jgi:hypothetical protein
MLLCRKVGGARFCIKDANCSGDACSFYPCPMAQSSVWTKSRLMPRKPDFTAGGWTMLGATLRLDLGFWTK